MRPVIVGQKDAGLHPLSPGGTVSARRFARDTLGVAASQYLLPALWWFARGTGLRRLARDWLGARPATA